MALSATNLLNYQATPGSSPISITTTSFTPSSDVMLVAVVGFSDINSSNHTDNTTLTSTGGVTWTKVSGTTINIGPRNNLYVSGEIYVAQIGTSPGSITATHTRTGTRGSASCTVNIHIHEVSGSTTGYETGETMAEEDTAQDGAVNGTLSGTPASGSLVIGSRIADAINNNPLYADPGTNWIELSDYAINYYWCSVQCQYRVDPGTSTVAWADVAVSNSIDVTSELVGVEIKAASLPLDFPSSPSEGDRYRQNNITYYYKNGVWRKAIPSNMAMITFGMDNDGTALATGNTGPIYVPNDFEIIRWTLIGDQSGSANVDLWSCEYGTTPTAANTMTGNVGMTISSSTANQSGDTMSWTMKKVNAGNVVTYNIQSVSTITRLTVNLFGIKGQ